MIIVRRLPVSVKQIGQRKVGITSSSCTKTNKATMSSGQQNVTSSAPNATNTANQSPSSSSSSVPNLPGGSSSGACSTTGGTSGTFPFDWAHVFGQENKKRTIELLSLDRENCGAQALEDNDPRVRKAAVLIPLCYDLEGKPCLLYNLRASTLSKHKGEISFPGGAFDPEDQNNPVTTALRETHEELGIPSEAIEVWTELRVFPTISTHLKVIPILGFVKTGPVDAKKLQINPDEVDHAFTVSLEHLCNSDNWGVRNTRDHKGKSYMMPKWVNLGIFNSSEEIPLWGLTAFITHLTLLAFLPKEMYTRSISYIGLNLGETSNSDNGEKDSSNEKSNGKDSKL